MASNLAIWAVYSSLSVSVATGVGVATGVIPADILNRFTASQEGPQSLALAPPTAEPPAEQQPAALVEEVAPDPAEKEPAVAEQAQPKLPEFDILRLEKDGSALVAGRAEADALVELVTPDGTVLGHTKAGPGGDFVILPDDLLPPGDYALTLRSTKEGSKALLSRQTGILRIPGAEGGERLAMVTEDGAASRIMIKPETLQKADIQTAMVEQPKPAGEAAPQAAESAPTAQKPEAPSQPENGPQKSEPAVAASKPDPAPSAVAKTELTKDQMQKPEVAETSPQETAAEVAVRDDEPVAVPVPSSAEEQASPQVLVEAVEVENGKIYIAGAVKQGSRVRVYINNRLVGTARGTSDDRFLIQRTYNLPAGQHAVRADVVSSSTGEVRARAEVPLIHEPQPSVEVAAVPAPLAEAQKPKPPAEGAEKPALAVQVEPVAEPQEVAVAKPASEPVADETVEKPAMPITSGKEPVGEQTAALQPGAEENETESASAAPATREPGAIYTGRSIIIRPGDNLWRISRKTYGSGIRYTTIYNANREQIRDPNRIYVGQIFKLPDSALQ